MPRVLLVDDDLDQLDIRRLVLEEAGHTVRTAASSEEALACFRESRTDSVVMDLHLPRSEDGLQLIRDLRALSDCVNIVVTTGSPAGIPGAREHAMVNHVLLKPFKTAKLLRLLMLAQISLPPSR
jgi:CheY-like chemotaxis protein